MKYFLLTVLSVLMLASCSNEALKEKANLVEMNKSFKVYIRDNDLRKNFVTKLTSVEALSYIVLETDSLSEEYYEAKVRMRGTTSLMNSLKIYNINDTVICYFDKNLRMLRLVNPNSNQ